MNYHQEVIDRVHYNYLTTRDSLDFPNSFEGDLIKIAYTSALIAAEKKRKLRFAEGTLDAAIGEIEYSLLKNKSEEVREQYLRNALRYIKEFKEAVYETD